MLAMPLAAAAADRAGFGVASLLAGMLLCFVGVRSLKLTVALLVLAWAGFITQRSRTRATGPWPTR
jgi:hypothetical protein